MKEFGSAVILAGGKSSRMGFDKQNLKILGQSLVYQHYTNLSKIFDDIIIVTNTPYYYNWENVRVISDLYQNLGPLAGIHAALKISNSKYIFVVACDMVNINEDYIKYLMDRLRNNKADACITQNKDWIEPFHGFYSVDTLPVIESDLSEGKSSIYYFLKKVNTLMIPVNQAFKFSPDESIFINLNTREEYESYIKLNNLKTIGGL